METAPSSLKVDTKGHSQPIAVAPALLLFSSSPLAAAWACGWQVLPPSRSWSAVIRADFHVGLAS